MPVGPGLASPVFGEILVEGLADLERLTVGDAPPRLFGVLRATRLRADGLRLGGEPLDERRGLFDGRALARGEVFAEALPSRPPPCGPRAFLRLLAGGTLLAR